MKKNKWWYIAASFLVITLLAWFYIIGDTSDGLTGKEVYHLINGYVYYIVLRALAGIITGLIIYHLGFTESGKLKMVAGGNGQLLVIAAFAVNILAWFIPIAIEKSDTLLKILNP